MPKSLDFRESSRRIRYPTLIKQHMMTRAQTLGFERIAGLAERRANRRSLGAVEAVSILKGTSGGITSQSRRLSTAASFGSSAAQREVSLNSRTEANGCLRFGRMKMLPH
jgi:hypothetical protein